MIQLAEDWNPKRLKEAMVIRELSNMQLGERLGVSWQTIAKWKSNHELTKYKPTPEQLWEICKITQFPLKHFITEDKVEYENSRIFY